jgi:hypothetical protein
MTIFDEINEQIREEKGTRRPAPDHRDGGRVDVPRYLADHGIQVLKEKAAPGGGTMFCLEGCVFDPNHGPNEAAVIQATNGQLLYQCFHETCKGRIWADARRQISGDEKLGAWMVGGNGFRRPGPASEEDEERAAIREEGGGPQQDTCEPEKPRFEFIHNADILKNLRPIEWRIRDILTDYALYYNFGDPASFKTFIEMDRLLSIASGIDYHGHQVKQGTVFYICGEGWQGIGRRIAAWHISHGTRAANVPFFVSKTPTQLMDLEAIRDVRVSVDTMTKEYGQPAVVHIDTLARNFGEGDENATKDMNAAISNLDRAFGSDFCRGLTHHTGHGNKDRARGSIALHGAADGAFRVSLTDSGQIVVQCKKLKDAPTPPLMVFNRQEVLLRIGDTEDRSYVMELEAEGDAALRLVNPQKAVELKGGLQKALDVLRRLYARYEDNLKKGGRSSATPQVSFVDWRTACMDSGLYKRTDNFRRAAETLLLNGFVKLDESGKFIYLKEIIQENGE